MFCLLFLSHPQPAQNHQSLPGRCYKHTIYIYIYIHIYIYILYIYKNSTYLQCFACCFYPIHSQHKVTSLYQAAVMCCATWHNSSYWKISLCGVTEAYTKTCVHLHCYVMDIYVLVCVAYMCTVHVAHTYVLLCYWKTSLCGVTKAYTKTCMHLHCCVMHIYVQLCVAYICRRDTISHIYWWIEAMCYIYIYIYIHIYIHTYIHIYTYVYIHIYIHGWLDLRTHTCYSPHIWCAKDWLDCESEPTVYVCMYVCMHVYHQNIPRLDCESEPTVYVCACVCMYVGVCEKAKSPAQYTLNLNVYVCMYVWIHVCMYAYMFVIRSYQDSTCAENMHTKKVYIKWSCSILSPFRHVTSMYVYSHEWTVFPKSNIVSFCRVHTYTYTHMHAYTHAHVHIFTRKSWMGWPFQVKHSQLLPCKYINHVHTYIHTSMHA